MTWLTLSHSEIVGGNVRLRFCPDVFVHERDAPVVEVTVVGAERPEAMLEQLARFRTDFVVELAVEAHKLRLVGGMDYEETVVVGECVQVRQVPYSIEELRQTAVIFERLLREARSDSNRKSMQLKDVRHFVADLVARAERKQALSGKTSELSDAQISVLHRVLNKLDDAK